MAGDHNMNQKQPEALRLADALEFIVVELEHDALLDAASTELRRLHQSEQKGRRYVDELELEVRQLFGLIEQMRDAAKEGLWP